MKTHQKLETHLTEDENAKRFSVIRDPAERSAAWRRVQNGDLVRPAPGMVARSETFESLNPAERTMHMGRAWTQIHETWTFTGIMAALAYGIDAPWSLCRPPFCVVRRKEDRHDSSLIKFKQPCGTTSQIINGIRVCSVNRMLQDCSTFPFDKALPIFDAALRLNLDVFDGQIDDEHKDFQRLITAATPMAESGGESRFRALVIQLGFREPLMQHTFTNKKNGRRIRVDFLWANIYGELIVVEFDGMQKYFDPNMTGNRELAQIVENQEERTRQLRDCCNVGDVHRIKSHDLDDVQELQRTLESWGIPYRFSN